MNKLINSLKKLSMKQKKIIISVGLLLIISLLVGISYSYYLITAKQEGSNIVRSACFKINYEDQDDIHLEDVYPFSDEEGSRLEPYKFKIKNVCNTAADYQVNLETLNVSTLETDYIKSKLDDENIINLGYLESYDSFVNEDAKESRKLASGVLVPNEEVSYQLRLWIDEESTVEQSSQKYWEGKVVVISSMDKNPYRRISLNATGGEVEPNYIQIIKGRVVGELPIARRNGFTFNGWYSEENEGNQVTETTTYAEDTEIYAHWNRNKYDLTINPNEGEWESFTSNQTYHLDYEEEKEINDPVRTGYHFTNWSVEGQESSINNKVFKMGYENTIITANYEKNTYTLTIDPNEGKWNESSEDQEVNLLFEEEKEISDPVREGYTFTGWTLTGDGATLQNKTFKMGYQNAKLKATWEINNYPYIAYHYQENINDDNYTLVSADTESGELPYKTIIYPAVKNYTGFTSPASKQLVIEVEEEYPPIKNKVEYNYTRNKYSITINPNGGSYNNSTTNTVINDVKYQKETTINDPVRDKYTFQGWTKEGNATLTNKILTMGSENVTLTATWKKNSHIITFNANGGSVSPGSKEVDDGATTTLPTPTRTDYRFDGWFTDPTGGTQVTNSTVWTESQTIYAHWTLNTYTITYNANGGSVSPGSATVNHGGTLSLPTPTRSSTAQYSYTFAGWYTACSGGSQVTNSTTWTSSQTICAHWTSSTRSYTLTVNSGTGSGTYAYGTNVTITASVPGSSTSISGSCSQSSDSGNTGTRYTTSYYFSSWSDGNTSQSRTITVTGNATYTANISSSNSSSIITCCRSCCPKAGSPGVYSYSWSSGSSCTSCPLFPNCAL